MHFKSKSLPSLLQSMVIGTGMGLLWLFAILTSCQKEETLPIEPPGMALRERYSQLNGVWAHCDGVSKTKQIYSFYKTNQATLGQLSVEAFEDSQCLYRQKEGNSAALTRSFTYELKEATALAGQMELVFQGEAENTDPNDKVLVAFSFVDASTEELLISNLAAFLPSFQNSPLDSDNTILRMQRIRNGSEESILVETLASLFKYQLVGKLFTQCQGQQGRVVGFDLIENEAIKGWIAFGTFGRDGCTLLSESTKRLTFAAKVIGPASFLTPWALDMDFYMLASKNPIKTNVVVKSPQQIFMVDIKDYAETGTTDRLIPSTANDQLDLISAKKLLEGVWDTTQCLEVSNAAWNYRYQFMFEAVGQLGLLENQGNMTVIRSNFIKKTPQSEDDDPCGVLWSKEQIAGITYRTDESTTYGFAVDPLSLENLKYDLALSSLNSLVNYSTPSEGTFLETTYPEVGFFDACNNARDNDRCLVQLNHFISQLGLILAPAAEPLDFRLTSLEGAVYSRSN